MSNTGFKVRFDENGDIVDILGGGCLKSTPEEKVRQRFIETLINEYHYPANTIRREVPIQHGSKELRDNDGNPVRADIVVYASKAACLNRDQGKINFVVECKRNKVEDGYAQLVSYIFNTSANGGVWTNGDGTVFYRRENKDGIQVLEETSVLPRCGQGWEDGRTPRIGELERPRNSLDKYSNLDGWITSHCPKGTPDIIITNPPFSGQKTESMMMDPDILKLFGFGHKPDPEGAFPTITDDDDRDAGHGTLLIRQAPELLFLERCIDWLKPGGRIGIVLPKGILDNRTYINYRRWMLSRCKVDAVVTLHKNTFEPDTGVRTCVLFLSKPLEDDPVPGDYTIFMAQSRRVGKDSKGEPVFALDEKGSATSELDEDLTQIAEAYKTFRDIGTFTESETCFTAERGELDDNLNLNPQHYSPELNATLEKVSKFDDKPDWSVTTIGQLDKNIRIYMGPRWSSRSLVVEDPSDTTNLTPYLTANGALEQRRMTVKWFDMSRATDKQKECVRMLRVQKGDILISRSGTIGKVTYATRILADKYVISDDLVRVRVPDENMRAYLLAFLMSSTAMNLMKLDEFGSVQQHLQPRHIWGLPVPVPDSWEQVSPIIDAGKGMISAMEQTSLADESLRTNGFDSLIE